MSLLIYLIERIGIAHALLLLVGLSIGFTDVGFGSSILDIAFILTTLIWSCLIFFRKSISSKALLVSMMASIALWSCFLGAEISAARSIFSNDSALIIPIVTDLLSQIDAPMKDFKSFLVIGSADNHDLYFLSINLQVAISMTSMLSGVLESYKIVKPKKVKPRIKAKKKRAP